MKNSNNKCKEKKVPKDKREQETTRFIQESILMKEAADIISANFLLIKAAAILYHYSIELLLKACDVWENNAFLYCHDLFTLNQRITFIQLEERDERYLKIITEYFNYRYPLNSQVYNNMEKILKVNADEIIAGITPLPGEFGSEDLDRTKHIYDKIFESAPEDIIKIYNSVVQSLTEGRVVIK